MKITTKVTLASLLIFPGAGHLILKKWPIAFGFIISFIYLLYGFVNQLVGKSQEVVDNILQGKIPLEINAIKEALAQQNIASSTSDSIAVYLLLFLWLLAAFDAYRLSKKNPTKPYSTHI